MTQERRQILEAASDTVTRTFVCSECREKVDVIGTTLQWHQFDQEGENRAPMHDIFPELGSDVVNIMIAGLCNGCFDRMFEKELIEPLFETGEEATNE